MALSTLFEKYGRSYRPGEVIFHEGEEGQYMFIIQTGNVQIAKNMHGHTHVLSELAKGEFFGEMAIVTRVKRTATATALDEVQLLAFDRNDFQGMIEKNSKIALNVIDKLCRRLQHANAQIRHLVHSNFKSAVALNLYLRFQRAPGRAVAGSGGAPPGISADRTRREIAKNIGIEEEIVRRVVEDLANERVLALDGNSIRLLDEAGLCKVADESL